MTLKVPAELTLPNWQHAGRRLLAKALAELSYEELLQPEKHNGGFRVRLGGGLSYEFEASRGSYDSWFVVPGSVVRWQDGTAEPAYDVLRFILDARETLGLTGDTIGHLIRELTATLSADVRLDADAVPASELANLPYAELEGYQTGHPWIVPNKGRMGWSASDSERYPPEARRPMRLPWIAVKRSIATYRGVPGLSPAQHYLGELDEPTRERFTDVLRARGLDPSAYHWLPVHPWQWDEIVLPLFAPDIAAEHIVVLGESTDEYLVQQSVRTFTNVSTPSRHHVKLPLSVLNTLVWRGLPTERTLAAPDVTAWVLGLRDNDPFLAEEARPVLLGEIASVTVQHQALESVPGVPYQYRELLGAIWRESLEPKLDSGEKARTLAALLYVDPQGDSLLATLVRRSGLDPADWLGRLFQALLPSLLHFLYKYGVVFSPHGENTIVAYDSRDIPTRLVIKDFVDDVNISAKSLPELANLPSEVDGILLREPPDFLCQFIHSGLFVGHFRYLAEIARTQLGVPVDVFWKLVRTEILAYQERFGLLAERFALFDLLTPRIDRLCLNRNRLLLDGYRDRPERPHAAVHGTVSNPLLCTDPADGSAT